MDNLREIVDDLWGEIDEVFPIPSRVLPDPDTLDYYLFARQRKFFLTTNLEYGAYDLSRDIIYLNTQDVGKAPDEHQPIIIYIMSDGGSLDEMWMLTDIMLASETPIITVNLGQAASAAALVFLSAPKRLMLPSAKVNPRHHRRLQARHQADARFRACTHQHSTRSHGPAPQGRLVY